MASMASVISIFVLLLASYCHSAPVKTEFQFSTVENELTSITPKPIEIDVEFVTIPSKHAKRLEGASGELFTTERSIPEGHNNNKRTMLEESPEVSSVPVPMGLKRSHDALREEFTTERSFPKEHIHDKREGDEVTEVPVGNKRSVENLEEENKRDVEIPEENKREVEKSEENKREVEKPEEETKREVEKPEEETKREVENLQEETKREVEKSEENKRDVEKSQENKREVENLQEETKREVEETEEENKRDVEKSEETKREVEKPEEETKREVEETEDERKREVEETEDEKKRSIDVWTTEKTEMVDGKDKRTEEHTFSNEIFTTVESSADFNKHAIRMVENEKVGLELTTMPESSSFETLAHTTGLLKQRNVVVPHKEDSKESDEKEFTTAKSRN